MERVGEYAVLAQLHEGWWKRVDLARRVDEPGAPLVRLTRWSEDARAELGDFLSDRVLALVAIGGLLKAEAATGVVVQRYLSGGTLADLAQADPGSVPVGLGVHAALALARELRGAIDVGYPCIVDPRDLVVAWDGSGFQLTDLRPVPPLLSPPTLGDLRWHAPELLQRAPFDESAAVWCVGEVIFTALAGPFFDGDAGTQLSRKQREAAPRLSSRRPGEPAASVEGVLRRACQRDPGARPSLDELIRSLEAVELAPGGVDRVRGWAAMREQAQARDARARATSLPLPVGHEELLDDARLSWLRAQLEASGAELPDELLPDERLLRTQEAVETLAAEVELEPAQAAAMVEAWRAPVDDAGELSWMSVHTSSLPGSREDVEVNAYLADLQEGLVERRVVARGSRAVAEGAVALPGRADMNTGAFRRLLDRLFRR